MAKITVAADCGNSPKMLFLKDFNIAFAEGDRKMLSDSVTDDITWNMVGDKVIQGKADFVAALEQMAGTQTAELIINTVVTHGKAGAVDGTIILENGEQYAFCDVYAFGSAKGNTIKSMTSYVIQV